MRAGVGRPLERKREGLVPKWELNARLKWATSR